jgi:MoaA/NifB/PqqE/SkfB family radical SAM enzyme
MTGPAPRLDLKIGFSCNNRCRFCVQGDKRKTAATPALGSLLAELESSRSTAAGVVFTGGEPTLRPDLVDLVTRARELGYSPIQIQSNGRMFASRAYCDRLIEAGATEFSPALHGHVAALHDHLTRAPGSFAQTVAGIRNLRALGMPVVTNSVVVRSNAPTLPRLARLLLALDVTQFQLAFVHPVGAVTAAFTSLVPRMELIAPALARSLRLGLAARVPAMTEAVPYCILPGLEECVVEARIPPTRVVDAGVTVEDYREYRLREGKLKGPACRDCRWFDACEGPWREYPERYGFGEFQPVARGETG